MRRPLADFGLFFILIILLIQVFLPHKYPDLSYMDNKIITISGTLINIEYKKQNNELIPVLYIDTYSNNREYPCNTSSTRYTVICYMSKNTSNIPLGSLVNVRGKCTLFTPATTPGCFDKKKYYETIGISYALYNAILIESDPGNSSKLIWKYRTFLLHTKTTLAGLCDLCLSPEDSGVVKTMLIGDNSSIDESIKSLYSANGIAHILSISGLHVTFLGLAFYKLIRKAGRNELINCGISIIVMLTYGIMVGMPTSAARAIIIFILSMISKTLNRTPDALTSLILSALLLLISNPLYIFYSGFLFSYGAVLGIILIPEMLPVKKYSKLIEILSVNVFTLPVYLNYYFYFPLTSIILNIIIIPLMSILMICILITIVIAMINLPFGIIIGQSIHYILKLYLYLCLICEKLPINRLINGKPFIWQIIIYLCIIATTYIFRNKLTRFQIYLNLILAGIILSAHLSFGTEITLIDVGQGDGIFITDNNGCNLLIDGGSSSKNNIGQYVLSPFLLSKGANELDAIFITHLDTDHYNGILELIELSDSTGPKIKQIYVSESVYKSCEKDYEALSILCSEHNIPIFSLSKGDCIAINKMDIDCLNPPYNTHSEDSNSDSLVLFLRINKYQFYFTGDLQDTGEENLIRYLSDKNNKENGPPSDSFTVLKVAHHGSKNSTSDSLLSIMQPDIALISAGKNNKYGHPHEELIERLQNHNIPYYSTIDYGALTIKIIGNKLTLNGYISR